MRPPQTAAVTKATAKNKVKDEEPKAEAKGRDTNLKIRHYKGKDNNGFIA